MRQKRRRFAAEFKARVAWAAAREFFADRRSRGKARDEVDVGPLYEEIGWLKGCPKGVPRSQKVTRKERRSLGVLVVGDRGVEPRTSAMSRRHSSHLS